MEPVQLDPVVAVALSVASGGAGSSIFAVVFRGVWQDYKEFRAKAAMKEDLDREVKEIKESIDALRRDVERERSSTVEAISRGDRRRITTDRA